jgi:ribulose-5-phosphate 4-epimerase/fuculose-1-phosphate aldolase
VRYAIVGDACSPALAQLTEDLGAALEHEGFTRDDGAGEPDLVVNLVDPASARPFRRRARGTFVAALYEREGEDDGLAVSYPLLVRALANVVLGYEPGEGVWFTTLERGHYEVGAEDGGLADAVVARLAPLARARLVIDNEFRIDLERELWRGDEVTEEIGRAGKRLDELDLLPSPFPVDDLLDERDLRHVQRLYGLGGLSYGNLSARKDERRFWMSASGVDKSKLEVVGRDILLVTDYVPAERAMKLSVPPGIEPRRVSVDTIEHWKIYTEHPEVGAIMHVHAWIPGIRATMMNYPCGTHELAVAVADIVREASDPGHAVVGLKNHGVTLTGETLDEIFERVGDELETQVPMTA